jgi:Ni/Fe-hydrogenase subunit HybB-like protein
MTPAFKVLMAIGALGIVALAIRYAMGLGAASAMTDGYAWGIWIALDVVVGTALGCGGYAMALLVYLANKGEYHPLVRPAMLTGALGYTFAATSILVDVGRYWGIWKIPTYVTWWNFNSALLEVALCVMTYVFVLWLEFSPSVFEWAKRGKSPRLRSLSEAWHPRLERALPWIIALGMLLPTMHQSSLGTTMMLPVSKVHPLYLSPLLPLLFLVNCIILGYGAVILEATVSSVAWKRPDETPLLARLAPLMSWLILAWTAIRLVDLVVRGSFGAAFRLDLPMVMFWVETILGVATAVLLRTERRNRRAGLFGTAVLVVVAGVLYRFDAYIIAYDPGPGWSYFPSVLEILVTAGLVAIEIMVYVFVVKFFPVLSAAHQARAPAPAA